MEDDCIVVENGINGDIAEVELDDDGTVSIETLRCHFGSTATVDHGRVEVQQPNNWPDALAESN